MPVAILDQARLVGGAAWLYGLQEQAGSTTAGDVSGGRGRPILTLSPYGEFGVAGTMPEGTAVKLTRSELTGYTGYLESPYVTGYMGGAWTMFCQFAWTGSTGVDLFRLGPRPVSAYLGVWGGWVHYVSPNIRLYCTPSSVICSVTGPGGAIGTVTKTLATNDGRPHMAVLVGGVGSVTLYVDSETPVTRTVPPYLGTIKGLRVGGHAVTDEAQLAWVGLFAEGVSATEAGHLTAMGSGAAERSDLRVARLLRYLDLPVETEVGQSDIAYQATGDKQALDLIADVHDVEGGTFFVTGDGRFVSHSRTHRYNPTPKLTVSAADIQQADFAVPVDQTGVVNDVMLSRPAGATVRVRDQASIDLNGRCTLERTIWAASDSDLLAAAEWRVNRFGTLAPRVPSITLDLLTNSPEFASAVLTAEVGDVIRITDLPADSPGGQTLDVFIEGFTETVSPHEWTVTLTTSPARGGYACKLDDSTWARLNSTASLAY